jgi:hypothetical protein
MNYTRLLICIVNKGRAEDVLTELRAFGGTGGLVLPAEGTVHNKVLDFLGLSETEKEVILLPLPGEFEQAVHEMLTDRFSMEKKNKGIAFTLPLTRYQGELNLQADQRYDDEHFAYKCAFLILDHGESWKALRHANAAGFSGGTIIQGRGAGVITQQAFALEERPEKDILMMIVETSKVAALRELFTEELGLEEQGAGIFFSLPVTHVTGLYSPQEA